MPSRRTFLAGAAVLLGGCTTDTDQGPNSQQKRTSSTGTGNRGTTGPGTEPPTGETVQWRFDAGGPISERLVVADGTVFVAGGANGNGDPPSGSHIRPKTGQNLYALGTDGSERWRFEADAGVFEPTVAESGVYVATGWNAGTHGVDQRVVRVEGGESRWQTEKTGSYLSLLATEGDRVFVCTGDDAIGMSGESMFALDGDGTEAWRMESGDVRDATLHEGNLVYSVANSVTTMISAADGETVWTHPGAPVGGEPELGDGLLLLDAVEQDGNGDYPVLGVDPSDGTERWRYASDEGDEGPFVCPGGVIDGGQVVGTEYGGLLFGLDATDGAEQWTYPVSGETRDAPAVTADTAFVTGMDGSLHAVNRETGERRWQSSITGIPRGVATTGDSVVVWTSGKSVPGVYAFGPDGSERWSFRYDGSLGQPVVAESGVYVATRSGYVVRLGR
ncbi:PQQ-binding-like beta-propeller repeat protein [Haloarchaeobius sp. TZWWS8]|uniref:PQQ-binding-like beta-propeller repeat protein n=1 Tax=Haloarchaeobius sp. TZWWS8 TaxID=3446121 RepID=UPI003EC0F8F7